MIIGSSGACVEICGDSKNFGLLECDDGNLVNGDGCSSACEIEADWTCTGGSPTNSDICSVTELKFDSVNVTENNNLVLKFTKTAYIIDDLTTDDIEI
jgi:cysteine-rich repeat protein